MSQRLHPSAHRRLPLLFLGIVLVALGLAMSMCQGRLADTAAVRDAGAAQYAPR